MKTSSTTQTTWFVEPLDAFTNQIISDGLRQKSTESEQESMDVVEKKDGEKVVRSADIWEVPEYSFITTLRSVRNAKFKIFRKIGLHGQIEEAIFLKKKRASRRQKKSV